MCIVVGALTAAFEALAMSTSTAPAIAASEIESSYDDSMPVAKNQLERSRGWNLSRGSLVTWCVMPGVDMVPSPSTTKCIVGKLLCTDSTKALADSVLSRIMETAPSFPALGGVCPGT